ncbi:MAG: phosphopyruvate hydratase [Eubacteriales bacterium]|nr:phosphopyruvate hydratase [Eubacteriales bacterium]
MHRNTAIIDIYAREILDSRGNPTIEAEVLTECGVTGRAAVPSGASTGEHEAMELRDGQERYLGKGVQKAVSHVNTVLADAVIGENVLDQAQIDKLLLKEDGTPNKSRLGANALLAVSMAAASAAAKALNIPLFRYLGGMYACQMPVPMFNVLNGGCHSRNLLDFQEFMIMPVGAENFSEGLRMGAEVYQYLKKILDQDSLSVAVGDEGGFAPDLRDAKDVFRYLERAVKEAGYTPGKDMVFAMDAAASELYDNEKDGYVFEGESRMKGERIVRSRDELIRYYQELAEEFPLCSIEDGLDENDWEGWKRLTETLGKRLQLVGDDLFVTNPKRLKKGIQMGVGNAVLVKVNQIGTLTEAFETMELAKRRGYRTVVSHRSGETEDTFLADIAVAVGAGQIKTGAPCRSERVAKYNRLLRIEDYLGDQARYGNPFGYSTDST